MIFLVSDYSEGATPEILEALKETNLESTVGYGLDPHCLNAAEMIKKRVNTPNADVHFFVGGTQTNLTAIAGFLRPHQAVISPETGHICVHETGAVEATGHKVIHVPSKDGKIKPEQITEQLRIHEDEHWVMPKMVYITNSTDLGTVYTKSELQAISKTCKENDLYLYLDGARLASALTCSKNDLTIEDIAEYTDAFYLGGTKNGMLFGEALVITNNNLKEDFRWILKQKGGMLAKGRLLGVQFETILKDDLYFKLGQHANNMADKLRRAIADKGYTFYTDSPTNIIFPILPNDLVEKLSKHVEFEKYFPIGEDKYCIRFVTSWATKEDTIDELVKLI